MYVFLYVFVLFLSVCECVFVCDFMFLFVCE